MKFKWNKKYTNRWVPKTGTAIRKYLFIISVPQDTVPPRYIFIAASVPLSIRKMQTAILPKVMIRKGLCINRRSRKTCPQLEKAPLQWERNTIRQEIALIAVMLSYRFIVLFSCVSFHLSYPPRAILSPLFYPTGSGKTI